MPGNKRLISVGNPSSESGDGHGSCCASKAVGRSVGIARKADLVAVVLDLRPFSILKAWQAVVLDVQQNGLRGKAVIGYSLGSKYPSNLRVLHISLKFSIGPDDSYFSTVLEQLIEDLINLDVVIVSAPGNGGVSCIILVTILYLY